MVPSRAGRAPFPSRTDKRERLLDGTPCLEISAEKAGYFLCKEYNAPPGTKPFLVRAVFLNRGTGAFSAYFTADSLKVEHGSLGKSAVPMKRQALVVSLERLPKEVFVDCDMCE